jgi:putative ABC transport system permease protein
MNRVRSVWIRIVNIFRVSKLESDLSEQLAAHREMIEADLIRRGMAPAEAGRKAREAMGNDAMVRELSRDEMVYGFFADGIRDIRHGLRSLARNRSFTAVAAVSLALGIGANTFIFGLINTTLLHPLGYPDPGNLIVIWTTRDETPNQIYTSSVSKYFGLRERSRSFEDLGAFNGGACGVRSLGFDAPGVPAERVYGQCFTPSLFGLLGAKPFLGRTFTEEEDRVGNVAPVILISHALWRQRFGSDPAVIGKTVTLNRMATTIIGVLPPDFRLFRDANVPVASRSPQIDFVAPLELGPTQVNSRYGGNTLVGRLKPNVSIEQMKADINAIATEMAASDPVLNGGLGLLAEPLEQVAHRDYRSSLLLLQGAVAFVLLISCANVAGLLLARNSARRNEIGLRIALGANRRRVLRQLVAEGLPLAFVGGAIGVLVSLAGQSIFMTMAPAEFALVEGAGAGVLNVRVLLFSVAVVVATVAFFAVLPAIQAVRSDLVGPAKEATRTSTASAHRQRLRSMLVMGQIALATVLLIGAGLMINSFVRVMKDLGADPDNLLTFAFHLPPADTIKVTGMYRGVPLAEVSAKPAMLVTRVLERIKSVPGVDEAAAVSLPPFAYRPFSMPLLIEGRTAGPQQPDTANYFAITDGFFRLMRIPLLKGRDFDAHDIENSRAVVIINEALARQFFPFEDPIGKTITLDFVPEERAREIVGIVGDTANGPLEARHQPAIYLPHLQQASQWGATSWTLRAGAYFVIRTTVSPAGLMPGLKAAVAEVDRNTPAADFGTVEQILDKQTRTMRLHMLLLGMFATVAGFDGRDGHIRRCGVFGGGAHARDWNPHGARRPNSNDRDDGIAAGRMDYYSRRGFGVGGRTGSHPPSSIAVVRNYGDGYGHIPRHLLTAGADFDHRLRDSRTACGIHRSGPGAQARLTRP